ncbi:MAG TPA: hypothetical protein VGC20_01935 [bacterium]
MKRETNITKQHVDDAIMRFLERGGLIKKLPPEVIPPAVLVGSQHGRFEPVSYYAHAEALYV